MNIKDGWLQQADKIPSPHYTPRVNGQPVNLLVVHNISLPPGEFGGDYISDLFLGRLDPKAHETFKDIYQLQVSAHLLIRREGNVIQYVSFDNKAWHAGVSCYNGVEKCNDFSIGIELEGTDAIPYTKEQYQALSEVTKELISCYPQIAGNIAGHSDIAPGRKTDPGPSFDWQYFKSLLLNNV